MSHSVQASLFGVGENLLTTPAQDFAPDPADVRRRLLGLLETARKAETMPWPEREARMWRIVFPQMADWLPGDEADRLRLAFARELARLESAA